MQSVPSDTWPRQNERHSAESLLVSPTRSIATNTSKKKKERGKKNFKTIFCFNPEMQGGMGKCVGRDWPPYGFLLSFNFEKSLLPSQDSVMHVKTQF